MIILLATHNRHKVEEIRCVLCNVACELVPIDRFPGIGKIRKQRRYLDFSAVRGGTGHTFSF